MDGTKDFYAALAAIQAELKAPKDLSNNFGGYRYRSAENILAAVKPLLAKHGLTINLTDTIMQIGDRFYLKAKAEISNGNVATFSEAYAREPLAKKGMDESQVTGSASSYARKYALCGLFGIDDSSADPDNPENHPDNPDTAKRDARIKAAAQKGMAAAKADKVASASAQAKPQTQTAPATAPAAPIITDAQLNDEVKACASLVDLNTLWTTRAPALTDAQKMAFTDRKEAIIADIDNRLKRCKTVEEVEALRAKTIGAEFIKGRFDETAKAIQELEDAM